MYCVPIIFSIVNLLILNSFAIEYILYNDVKNAILCEVCTLHDRKCNKLIYMQKLVINIKESSLHEQQQPPLNHNSYFITCTMSVTNHVPVTATNTLYSQQQQQQSHKERTIFEGQVSITNTKLYYQLSDYLTVITKEYNLIEDDNIDSAGNMLYEDKIVNILNPKL